MAANIVIYSFAHLAQGVAESIGAMILGFFLCLATIATGSIWVAFFVHLVMAISGSYFALRFNAEMRFVKK